MQFCYFLCQERCGCVTRQLTAVTGSDWFYFYLLVYSFCFFVLFCFYFCIRLLVERIFAAFYLTRDITSLIEKQIVNSLCLQETILLIIYYGGTYITFSCVLCFLQPWVFSLIMSSIKRLFEWIGAFSLLTFILEKTASSYGGKAFELLLTY